MMTHDAGNDRYQNCVMCEARVPKADMFPIQVPDEMDLGIRALWFCNKRCAAAWMDQMDEQA